MQYNTIVIQACLHKDRQVKQWDGAGDPGISPHCYAPLNLHKNTHWEKDHLFNK